MKTCHPSPLLGFSLPLLVALGTLAGSFGGNAKSNYAGHRSQTGQTSAFKTEKAPASALLTSVAAQGSVARLGSKPLFPLASLDFQFQGFFFCHRVYLFCNPSLFFVSLFCKKMVPSSLLHPWFGAVRESPGVHAMDEVLLSVSKCILHLKACLPPAPLCCLPYLKVRHWEENKSPA